MFAGLFCVFLEIFVPRGFALSLGLAGIVTGTLAVLGSSGVIPKAGFEAQIGVLVLMFLTFIAFIGSKLKQS